MKARVRPWSLWGLESFRADLLSTLSTAAVLLWSRFAFLASGPWEWDETLFARGMLHFELAAHFPHPPGFPGWLALGHCLLPLAGEPLIALQWASATASVVAIWPLSKIGRRVAPVSVATAAALVVLFLPGPWLFSVRGFSSTAAAVFALAASALWVRGLEGRRATLFSLLITGAFLIRPIVLPGLAMLWLCGALSVRPRRRLIPGIVGGLCGIAASIAVMAHLEGGWEAFVRPFAVHAVRHASRLGLNAGGFADLGLVRGVGGWSIAVVLIVIVLWGLTAWTRRVGRSALWCWVMILVSLIGPLLLLQNRTYARYAVPVQLAAAPLVAGALGTLPAAPVTVVLLGIAVAAGSWTMPLLEEQHTTRLAAWEALFDAEETAAREGWTVVVDPEVHPFASYHRHLLEAAGRVPPPLELSPGAPEPWPGIDSPWVVAAVHPELYLPSITGRERTYGGVSAGLERLSQQRFLEAAVIENPPLPVGTWWSREYLEDGTPFMWAGPDAELWLPPVPAETLIGVDLRPAPGDVPIAIRIDGGEPIEVDGRSDRTILWVRRRRGFDDRPVVVAFDRARGYVPGGGDSRPLAVQVFGVVVRPPGSAWGGDAATEWERRRLRLTIEGDYGPERFGGYGAGTWLEPRADLTLRLEEPGTVTLEFLSPRPTDPGTVVEIGGRLIGPVSFDRGVGEIEIDVGSSDLQDGVAVFSVRSSPFVPSQAGQDTDSRRLGVVLTALSFRPARPGPLCWWSGEGEGNPG